MGAAELPAGYDDEQVMLEAIVDPVRGRNARPRGPAAVARLLSSSIQAGREGTVCTAKIER